MPHKNEALLQQNQFPSHLLKSLTKMRLFCNKKTLFKVFQSFSKSFLKNFEKYSSISDLGIFVRLKKIPKNRVLFVICQKKSKIACFSISNFDFYLSKKIQKIQNSVFFNK